MKRASFLNERRRPPKPLRLLFLVAGLLLLATYVRPGPLPPRAAHVEGALTATPVPLSARDPGLRTVGALRFRRGWALASDAPRFGAISAMHVADGRVIAVNDAGDILSFALPGTPGAGRVSITALPVPFGDPVRKHNRDIEALAVAGDSAWAGYERSNLVARYRLADWRLTGFERPRAMRRWPTNAGSEAMVRLPDGRFLVFGEGRADDSAYSPVLMFGGDPSRPGTPVAAGRYRRPDGYRITDAALLPEGRLLLLNRRIDLRSWVSAKLVIADLPAFRAGATIEGREIATLASPLTVDNMEALSVAREGGRTIVRIASDDNFLRVQRTLLLEFELGEPAG